MPQRLCCLSAAVFSSFVQFLKSQNDIFSQNVILDLERFLANGKKKEFLVLKITCLLSVKYNLVRNLQKKCWVQFFLGGEILIPFFVMY